MVNKKETFADIVRAEGIGKPPKTDAKNAAPQDDHKPPKAKQTAALVEKNIDAFLTENGITRDKPRMPRRTGRPMDQGAIFDEGRKYVANGIDRRRIAQLCREKNYATIDLHGCTVAQSYELLTQKISVMHNHSHSVLEVVHGRGLHSRDGAVLPDAVRQWLRQQPMVLGYTEMPDNDGALRVLLRRAK